ncbi:MAG: cbb3-type cytochrome c oxidase subunit I [Myxococcota bacterium]
MTSDSVFADRGRGLFGWLFTTDHRRIGLLYLLSTTTMLGIGGIFALLIRLELLAPGQQLLSLDAYDRAFTMHGVVMIWLFMVPVLPAALGNYMVPLQIGAPDMAFPRLNLASWYVYLAGAVLVLTGLALGGADTGWTFYAPYHTVTVSAIVPVAIGVFVVGWSSVLTGINIIATTHTLRARGLGWMQVPLLTWAMYATSIILVAATPVLAVVLLLVAADHWLHWGIFDPARGGDPLLYQHLFWFYSHPAVYIMVLPAMGVVSDVLPTSAQRPPSWYKVIVVASVGIALVGFLAWGHHMFTAGMAIEDAGVFGVLSMLVAIFSAAKVFTWVGTLRDARILALRAPLVYALTFIWLFVFGGMSGVALATMSLDVHWHDTLFVVAHFHFIMVGGTLSAFFAALFHWFPKVTGRLYPERLGLLSAGLLFVGFNLTFIPLFLLGNHGMVRRAGNYAADLQPLNDVATVGSWVLALAVLLPVATLVYSAFRGRRAGPNPWRSRSFEWRSDLTPADYARGPYDYDEEPAGHQVHG